MVRSFKNWCQTVQIDDLAGNIVQDLLSDILFPWQAGPREMRHYLRTHYMAADTLGAFDLAFSLYEQALEQSWERSSFVVSCVGGPACGLTIRYDSEVEIPLRLVFTANDLMSAGIRSGSGCVYEYDGRQFRFASSDRDVVRRA